MNNDLKTLKREMLQRLFDAEFNTEYHDLLCRRYLRLDTGIKVSLAGAAVVAFAAVKLGGAEPWQTISGITAMLATGVLPLLKWNRLIPRIEAERLRWIGLKHEYQNAWNDAKSSEDWADAARELRRIQKRDNTAEKTGGIIPAHRDLLVEARRRVCRAHGMAKP